MKNIHVLPTDKPSRLVKIKDTFFITSSVDIPGGTFYNIYITSDEEIISSKDWFIDIKDKRNHLHQVGYGLDSYEWTEQYDPQYFKKIILTTDATLIADGVQAIDDEEFLEWFVKNPTCEHVDVSELRFFDPDTNESAHCKWEYDLPQEEPKQKKWDKLNKELDDALEEEFG